ncbi:nitric oxide-associated protein 1 [Bacillus rossius redtenbacheri]|uniref:nitric oxide-associated protein 1 n=1 Tax=Bacillus rossius redtenbacheri TaxID=93214 RepID=UPI002FDCD0F8
MIFLTCRVLSNILCEKELKWLGQYLKLGYSPRIRKIHASSACTLELQASEEDRSNQDATNYRAKYKILYNSVLENEMLKHTFVQRKIAERKRKLDLLRSINTRRDMPIALRHLGMVSSEPKVPSEDTIKEESCVNVSLPYSIHTSSVALHQPLPVNDSSDGDFVDSSPELQEAGSDVPSSWMADYEQFDESSLSDVEHWRSNYGTPDRSVPVSTVPCGGCGALLHCQDPGIPGYLPSELFRHHSETQLRAVTCQRCHFMRHYGAALSVNVHPGEYPRILSRMRTQRALVVLVVDLLDFPCSVWPGILDIIGRSRPVVVVGNKVDLLPADSKGYLDRVKTCLAASLEQSGVSAANVKHVALLSARTGYGVEELITKLQNIWEGKGDVYLVGCTNVGKSTLFNALLQSDYCKVQAVDLVQRATTSPWPGTTLNLLKFPILRPVGWQLYMRTKRLIQEKKQNIAEKKLLKMQGGQLPKLENPTLLGNIERTFQPRQFEEGKDPFTLSNQVAKLTIGAPGLDPKDSVFAESRWCYDTPGTVQPDQVLDLLTTEELLATLPRTVLTPRSFLLRPGACLFIAGLARLDYLEGPSPVRFTVLAADDLPLTVCEVPHAEEVYSRLLCSPLMLVPGGTTTRLDCWPGLSPAPMPLTVTGVSWRESCADVVLSSAGWVAVTPGPQKACTMRAWTPAGRGIYLRRPPLLRFAVNLRGPKQRASPAYRPAPTASTDAEPRCL